MATRLDVVTMARMYSQVPTTLLGQTQAYLLLNEEDRALWNEVSTANPMLLATSASLSFPANTASVAVTSPAILRLVMIGKQASSTNMGFLFEYPLKWLEFVELEAQSLVNGMSYQTKFHWDGATLHVRPFLTEATTLKLVYVPPITLGTGPSGTVLGNNAYLQQFTDLLAVRLAVRLLQVQGRDASSWSALAQERLKALAVQVAKPQDVEPNHVAMTDAYCENGGMMGNRTEY